MSIGSVMPSSHLIFCRPLLLLPPIPPSIRVFSSESTLHMRWPKYWCFSFSISPSKEHPGLISFRMDWLDLLAVQGTLKGLLQHHSSKAAILRCSPLWSNSHIYTWPMEKPTKVRVGKAMVFTVVMYGCERGKIPWRRSWLPTPVFLPRESHGQRSLAWAHEESDITNTFTASYIYMCVSVYVYKIYLFIFCLPKLKFMVTAMCCAVLSRSLVSSSLWPRGL